MLLRSTGRSQRQSSTSRVDASIFKSSTAVAVIPAGPALIIPNRFLRLRPKPNQTEVHPISCELSGVKLTNFMAKVVKERNAKFIQFNKGEPKFVTTLADQKFVLDLTVDYAGIRPGTEFEIEVKLGEANVPSDTKGRFKEIASEVVRILIDQPKSAENTQSLRETSRRSASDEHTHYLLNENLLLTDRVQELERANAELVKRNMQLEMDLQREKEEGKEREKVLRERHSVATDKYREELNVKEALQRQNETLEKKLEELKKKTTAVLELLTDAGN